MSSFPLIPGSENSLPSLNLVLDNDDKPNPPWKFKSIFSFVNSKNFNFFKLITASIDALINEELSLSEPRLVVNTS